MISVGQTVGNYKVTAKLGEGGMGVVYLAEHPVIGRKVALKAIHPELSKNPEVISRFMTEAKSVNQIGNEHIVDISDFGNTEEGEFYFVMEFLQGEALADRLRREHHFPPPRALKVAAQVADALAASHSTGIIHRDLKPENIYLITRGSNIDFVKVLDFGLAKLTQGEEKVTHKTRTGSVMGTPYYMSPEQCEGKANVDHRADVYSLGIIVFEMMTGKVPFGGEGYGEIIVKHITQAPPSPRAINPEIDEAHEAVILRALEKDREARFQNMADFRAAMLDPQGYLAGAPAPSMSSSTAEAAHVRRGDGRSGVSLGATSKPVPTTFRHGAGEISDDLELPKSRKGLVAGVVGAVAVVGIGAFLLLGRSEPAPADSPPVATTQPEPAAEPVDKTPEAVTIMFRSEPAGAEVLLKQTGESLGKTPLERQFEHGEQPVEFLFKLAGFADKTMSVVPSVTSKLSAALDQLEAPAKPDDGKGRKPAARPRRDSKPRETASDKPVKPKRPTVLDEDAVLEPQF